MNSVGEKLRPVIGIDIDSTLCDSITTLRRLSEPYLGRIPSEDEITDFYWESCSGMTREVLDLMLKDFHTHDEIMALPFLPNQGSISLLSEWADIWIISSRPESSEHSTKMWLDKHNVPFSRLILTEQKYVYAGCVSVMIEDSLFQAESMAEMGCPVVLMDRRWNQKETLYELSGMITRVFSWIDAVDVVADIMGVEY